jgi:hypothetical protein
MRDVLPWLIAFLCCVAAYCWGFCRGFNVGRLDGIWTATQIEKNAYRDYVEIKR